MSNINITGVKIYKLEDSKTLAIANITIDHDFVVTGLKVLNGTNGLWVSMPSKKNSDENSDKKYRDIAFPVTKEARQIIQDVVLDQYHQCGVPVIPFPEKNDRQKEWENVDVSSEDLPF